MGNAGAGVPDRNRHPVGPAAALATGRQGDFAVLGKFGRVAQKIEDRLAQLGGVGVDDAQIRSALDDKSVGVLGCQRPARRLDLADEIGQIDGFDVEVHLARLDLGDVEDIVDHGEKVLAGRADLLQVGDILAPLLKLGVFQQDFRIAEHGIERRSQFVAHLGQEFRLRAIGALGLFLGGPQHLHRVLVAFDFLQKFRLRIDRPRIVTRHEEHVGRRAAGRDDADLDHVLDRNVHGKSILKQEGCVEGGESERDLRKNDDAGVHVRAEVEERQQRHDQKPHQEGRTCPAIVIGTPQDREIQVEDRQQRQPGIVVRQQFQRDRKQPERGDRYRQQRDVRPRVGVGYGEKDRDRRAHDRPEHVTEQKHAHALLHMQVVAILRRRQPFQHPVEPAQNFHLSTLVTDWLAILPASF